MNQEIQNPAAIALAAISSAVEKWKKDNPPEKIHADTLKKLDGNATHILFKLLGFNIDSWGRNNFEIDHCNGRSGESAAGDYIRRQQQPAIDAWLSQVPMPKLTKAVIESVQKSAKVRYEEVFRDRVMRLAETEATAAAAAAYKEVSAELAMWKNQQLTNLLNS